MTQRNHDEAVDLERAFATFTEVFSPRRVAHVNDLVVKIVRIHGEFVWHEHGETDELFFVQRGTMVIRYRDHEVRLQAGQLHVVPRGVVHMTAAEDECLAMVFEHVETVNTGDAAEAELTVREEPFVTG